MKRFFAMLVVFLLVAGIFAKESSSNTKAIGAQFAIGSGYMFYGDKQMKNRVSDMNSRDFSRFILGGDVGMYAKLTDNAEFIATTDLFSDLFWKSKEYCFIFDYAFNIGLRVYPGLGGLSCALSYALGRRTAVIDIDDEDNDVVSTKWGNGFKCAVEYDLKYGTNGGIAPVIGTYWRHMPRGYDTSDNILSVYLRFIAR
ncbi:MAG: hypothetical protein K6E51_13680 [Treponema sp.]|nr:hypothetical protein [Treponema sp.]